MRPSGKPRLSDEELCERIRRYWSRVRGGDSCAVEIADDKPYTLPSGAKVTPRVIVSNMRGGLPPNVRSSDVPRAPSRQG